MKSIEYIKESFPNSSDQSWPWWPLLPLYPYGRRRTLFKEIIPKQVWSFEQTQGLYYVAVPVRLTVAKVPGGLMLINPLPPTLELQKILKDLEAKYGEVLTIVLPTASGLEHKISLPSLARVFPKASIWLCEGQWSFPFNLPLDLIGISSSRTKFLFKDGLPHSEICDWHSLGPLDIGLGRFQEVACFHKPSGALFVTDALVGIEEEPPAIYELDPTPLLFHSRDRGDQPLVDSLEARRRGWARLVLFASFLRPSQLDIPPISEVLRFSFRSGVRTPKAHFGIFPFAWKEDWEESAKKLLGKKRPLLQVAPVLERLIFPRAKESLFDWLNQLERLKGLKWLISAHYSPIVSCDGYRIRDLKKRIESRPWADSNDDYKFLGGVDKLLLKFGVVPTDPLKAFKD